MVLLKSESETPPQKAARKKSRHTEKKATFVRWDIRVFVLCFVEMPIALPHLGEHTPGGDPPFPPRSSLTPALSTLISTHHPAAVAVTATQRKKAAFVR